MNTEKQVCLTLPEELFQQIKKAAEEDFMAVNALIRVAIARYLRGRPCDGDSTTISDN